VTDQGTPDGERLRAQLYELVDEQDLSLNETQRQALELGRRYLGVETAHIQRHDGETHEVIASVGTADVAIPEGTTLDSATTYCRRTIEAATPVAVSNAPEEGWETDPAYEEHGWDCYLGTKVFVDGDIYGTVCFVSETARGTDFSSEEKAVAELIARLLGRAIEAAEYEDRLERTIKQKRQSEEKYEALLQLAPDAILIADANTGEIQTANNKAASLTGYTVDELHGKSVLDLHPPDDRERYVELLDAEVTQIRDEFDDGTPLYITRADGTDVPIELGISEIQFDDERLRLGIIRDISGRKARKRDIRLKDRAMEESTVGITIADASQADRPIIYANRGFEEVTGYSMGQAMGRNCRFLQGEGTDDETVADIRAAIENEEMIQTQLLNYRANGMPFWNKLTIAPVLGADGDEVTHYVGIQDDITAQKRRERLIEVLDRVLRHNLRNDMNVIGGFADVIAARTDDDEIVEIAEKIDQTATGLVSLTETVRRFETEMNDPKPLAPRDVVADIDVVIEELRDAYPDTTFTVTAADEVTVRATNQLRVALRELADNAAKHTDTEVELAVTADDETITIEVHDSGPGLPESERRVLEAGRETPLEHGSGLGLWLVNWIVTSLGGEVAAPHGPGATVRLRLPKPVDGVERDRRRSAFSNTIE